jgi:hypothetical protein
MVPGLDLALGNKSSSLAVLGQQLFTFVYHDAGSHDGLNSERNFDSFDKTFLLLFQCLTADGWSAIMADAMIDESSGKCSSAGGDCGTAAAIPYFISFQIIGSFVFLNLVVAVILENFATLHHVDPDLVSQSDVEVFGEAWAEFDPDATNFIAVTKLPALLLKVPAPLGLKGKSEQRAQQLCMRLRLTQKGGIVAFRELLKDLIDNNYFRSGMDFDEEEFSNLVPPLKLSADKSMDTPPIKDDDPALYNVDEPELVSLHEPTKDGFTARMHNEGISMDEYFAIKTFTKGWVKEILLQRLQRARERIAARKGKGGNRGRPRQSNGTKGKGVSAKPPPSCSGLNGVAEPQNGGGATSKRPTAWASIDFTGKGDTNDADRDRDLRRARKQQAAAEGALDAAQQEAPPPQRLPPPRRSASARPADATKPRRPQIAMPEGHLVAGGEPSDTRISRATVFGEGSTTALQSQARDRAVSFNQSGSAIPMQARSPPPIPGYADGLLKAKADELGKLKEAQLAMQRAEEKVQARVGVSAGQHWRTPPPKHCDQPFKPSWGDSRPIPMRSKAPPSWRAQNAVAVRQIADARHRQRRLQDYADWDDETHQA